MLKIDIICIASIKNNGFADLIDMYKKRIRWSLNIYPLESKQTNPQKCQEEEAQKILSKLNNQAVIIALDEHGKTYSSLNFAKKLETYTHEGRNYFQFIIGGANGLTPDIRNKADLLLSFGEQTWPHALARVMLLEQIYRSQQILAGHPYHRE